MKPGLQLLGILLIAGCSSSSDNGTSDSPPSVLFDPLSSRGSLLESAGAEEGLLDAARPARLRTVFTHTTDVTSKLTAIHGSPATISQSSIGQRLLFDVVNCEGAGTVAREVEIIDENLGHLNHKNVFDNCEISGTVLNGSTFHSLIESSAAAFNRGLQITADYEALSIDWSDGTRIELTGKYTSSTNQSVASSRGPEGNDYTETYAIDELRSTDITGGTSVLRNLEVRNSFRSYGPPLDQSLSLEMSGSWAMTSALGQQVELLFAMETPLASDANIGSTGKLSVTVTGGESVVLETQGGYQEQVLITRTDVAGVTTSDIVQWDDVQNLLGRLPRANCHLMLLAPVCVVP